MKDQLAYLCGVIHGDGWCGDSLGLRVADKDFAETFAVCVRAAFGVTVKVLPERSYWVARVGNATGRFDPLRTFEPRTPSEMASWLRGMFDSEGNAQLTHQPQLSPEAFHRKVAMYSTTVETLRKAELFLSALGIGTRFAPTNAHKHPSHKGTKVVYELALLCGIDTFARFATVVGSSIERKRATLRAIVLSYKPDNSGHCRSGQAKGAATRRRKALGVAIPELLGTIRRLAESGAVLTAKACEGLPGYATALHYFRHSEIVEMARNNVTPTLDVMSKHTKRKARNEKP